MSAFESFSRLPPEQEAIRARCFHPSEKFVEFPVEDVEISIPARFEKIVRIHSNRIAVETDHERITYAELNLLANRLANVVLAEDKTNGSAVVVILPRGIAQAVAILGVLKAGKMFLLKDPSGINAELEHMIADTQAQLIVTNKNVKLTLNDDIRLDARVIDLDNAVNSGNDQSPLIHVTSEKAAYIKYTSGSMARSKGVVISQRTLLQGAWSYTNSTHFCSEDRSAEINGNTIRRLFFVHLLNGATLCPFDIKSEGLHRLTFWLKRHDITMFRSFPGTFRLFANSLSRRERFPKIRMIRLSGEPMYGIDMELFKRHFSPECVLVHSYASSETGTISSFYIDHSANILSHRVPVGYPENGKHLSIINDFGDQVPIGQVGEIVVNSRFLSSGYWQRDGASARQFPSSSANPDATIYHTGDLGQLSTDGCLTLFGRKDDRVKIRNFRVDIGEIEAKLSEHPGVKIAIVTAKENSPGEIRLVAYVVARNQPAPTVTELREFLEPTLPPYMIPSLFVALAEMPTTATGKINRRALPEPDKSRPHLATPFVHPTTDIQQKLTAVWQEVLALDKIGVQDNFFELGGHSLAASRIIARIVKTFDLDLPLKALFESPTVAEMAEVITQNQSNKASQTNLERLLSELEAISDEEAEQTLTFTTAKNNITNGKQ